MTTTPESILARFAAEYAEHGRGPERRLIVTLEERSAMGYVIAPRPDNRFGHYFLLLPNISRIRVDPDRITRIDYSNARYRGAQPLWERTETKAF